MAPSAAKVTTLKGGAVFRWRPIGNSGRRSWPASNDSSLSGSHIARRRRTTFARSARSRGGEAKVRCPPSYQVGPRRSARQLSALRTQQDRAASVGATLRVPWSGTAAVSRGSAAGLVRSCRHRGLRVAIDAIIVSPLAGLPPLKLGSIGARFSAVLRRVSQQTALMGRNFGSEHAYGSKTEARLLGRLYLTLAKDLIAFICF
jgi:hypothetical protein